MKARIITLLFLFTIAFEHPSLAQTISKEELIFLTSEWRGERFADGRPKISDNLLERAKHIMIDDAWTVLRNEGYTNQFEGGWKTVNDTHMTGRAVTAMYYLFRSAPHPVVGYTAFWSDMVAISATFLDQTFTQPVDVTVKLDWQHGQRTHF